MFHYNPLFRCYFGNQKDVLKPKEYLALSQEQDILTLEPFSQLKKPMSLNRLIFLRQTHSTEGLTIQDAQSAQNQTSFSCDGDYLITNQPHVGLGVMTADCLPLIIVDPVHHAVGIAHAGWRGTVAGIGPTMLANMHQTFGTQADLVKVFFGPSARMCCYKVQESFMEHLTHIAHHEQFFIKKHTSLFFDNSQCNRSLLLEVGVPNNAINSEYNVCTICDPTYYSHRRGDAGRQMTVVSLI